MKNNHWIFGAFRLFWKSEKGLIIRDKKTTTTTTSTCYPWYISKHVLYLKKQTIYSQDI